MLTEIEIISIDATKESDFPIKIANNNQWGTILELAMIVILVAGSFAAGGVLAVFIKRDKV